MRLTDAQVVAMVEALAEYERGGGAIRIGDAHTVRLFLLEDCATSIPALRPLVDRYIAIRFPVPA